MGIKPLSAANSSSSIKTLDKPATEASLAETLAKKKLSTLNASEAQEVFEDDDSDSEVEIDVSDLVVSSTPSLFTFSSPSMDLTRYLYVS